MANPYASPQCTWWVWSQVDSNLDIQLPNWGDAENWYSRAAAAEYKTGGIGSAKPGDILCWGRRVSVIDGHITPGHVQYVVRDDGDTLYVSESYDGASSIPTYVNISKSNPTYGWIHGKFPFQGAIILNDSPVPPGPDPPGPEPPDPPSPGGWVYDHTMYVYIPNEYEYDPNARVFCEDQENPSTPTAEDASGVYPTGEEIQNVRWESLNEYTEERQIVYDLKSVGRWEDNWNTISTTGYDTSWGD